MQTETANRTESTGNAQEKSAGSYELLELTLVNQTESSFYE